MSITSLDKDYDNLALVGILDFEAPLERVWELFADPRKLERWWGPDPYPATVEEHDLTPGGRVTYFMTGPGGDVSRGMWQVESVDPPTSLEVRDRFCRPDGTVDDAMPGTSMTVRLLEHGDGTRVEMRSTFDSREQMEHMEQMGMVEGIRQAVLQMDAILGL